MDTEIYISIDVETVGPVPGLYSIISLGSAIFDHTGKILSTFSANLQELPECKRDTATMEEFWSKHPVEWELATKDARKPEEAMLWYKKWLEQYGKDIVFIGYPAAFDHSFIRYYMVRFTGDDYPLGHNCIDIRSYIMAVLGCNFKNTTKKHIPKEWLPKNTHLAVEDAIEQGHMFFKIRKSNFEWLRNI